MIMMAFWDCLQKPPDSSLIKCLCSAVFPLSLNLEPNHVKALQQIPVCHSFKVKQQQSSSRGPTPPGPNENTFADEIRSPLPSPLYLSSHSLPLSPFSVSLFVSSSFLLFLNPSGNGSGKRGPPFTADRGVFVCGCRPCPAGVDASETAANATWTAPSSHSL